MDSKPNKQILPLIFNITSPALQFDNDLYYIHIEIEMYIMPVLDLVVKASEIEMVAVKLEMVAMNLVHPIEMDATLPFTFGQGC